MLYNIKFDYLSVIIQFNKMNNNLLPDKTITLLDSLFGISGEIESNEYLLRKNKFKIFLSINDNKLDYLYFIGTTYSGSRNWDNIFLYYKNKWSFSIDSLYCKKEIVIKPIVYEITNTDNIYNVVLNIPLINYSIRGEKDDDPLYNLYNFTATIKYDITDDKLLDFKISSPENRLKLKSHIQINCDCDLIDKKT